ncbi:hypothetical protein DXB03_14535 [Lachnospiraceae bacterium OF11-28]|nr:hypothetical protein DXB03_14535 [Lachnospiraceae bacterium OF11-28]
MNFVPVYPSFTKTIALLKQAGTDVTAKLYADDVTQVKILYPTEYESTAAGENAVTGEDVPISEKSGGVTAETELKAVSYGGQKMITIVMTGQRRTEGRSRRFFPPVRRRSCLTETASAPMRWESRSMCP